MCDTSPLKNGLNDDIVFLAKNGTITWQKDKHRQIFTSKSSQYVIKQIIEVCITESEVSTCFSVVLGCHSIVPMPEEWSRCGTPLTMRDEKGKSSLPQLLKDKGQS